MKHLNKNREQLMLGSGLAMFLCSIAVIIATLTFDRNINSWQVYALQVCPWLFLAAALIYSFVQRNLRQSSTSLSVQRLYRIQTFSHIMLTIAGLLMIEYYDPIIRPFVSGNIASYQLYVQIVQNNWVVFMLIGAILQLYTVMRLSTELRKQA